MTSEIYLAFRRCKTEIETYLSHIEEGSDSREDVLAGRRVWSNEMGESSRFDKFGQDRSRGLSQAMTYCCRFVG
jgi:hypothetical protein